MRRKWIVLCSIFVLMTLAAVSATAQTVPANWKKFDGKFFSFSYPPDWKLTQYSDSYVGLQSMQASSLTMEIEYTTAYGGNLDNMLAAEKAGLQKIAAAWGLNITFDLPEPSRRGGKAIYGAMNNSAGIVLDTWVEGIAAGPSIYIIRMSTDPGPAFQNYTQYGYVLVDSIVFHLPAASLAGAWTSTVRQDSYKGQAVAFRNYDVLLNLGSSGSYTYTVQQSLPPSWELRVSGNWAVSNAAPANSQVSVQIKLTPVSIQWQPSAGLDTTTELARLRYEGYPGISEEMFGASTDINGSLYLLRLTDNALTNYKPSTAPAPATIRITDAASFSVAPVAQGSLISLFGTFGVTQSAASALPLPSTLSNLSVTVGGRQAGVLFVSPSQVNVQVPFEVAEGSAPIVVSVRGAAIATGVATVVRCAPKIFAYATDHAVAANQDYSLNGAANPARSGSYVTVYITGQGAFRTAVPSGAAAPSSPLAFTAAATEATIGGKPATVSYSGGAPGFAGVGQVNVLVPSGLSKGDYPLIIAIGGAASNALKVSVTP